MAHSHLALCDLEGPKSRSPRFQRLISRNGAELGYILRINHQQKLYISSPMTQSQYQ